MTLTMKHEGTGVSVCYSERFLVFPFTYEKCVAAICCKRVLIFFVACI